MNLQPSGVLSSQELRNLTYGKVPAVMSVRKEGITDGKDGQIQPSSIDLTLGSKVYGMSCTMLPKPGQPIEELAIARSQYSFEMEGSGFLHKGYTYLIPLNESVRLPKGYSARFSPKSSIGRIDTFVRVLADGEPLFDRLPDGYEGRLWLEVTPLSFPIKVHPNLSMVQMRLKLGDPRLTSQEVSMRQSKDGIFWSKDGACLHPNDLRGSEHGIYMHVDLDRDIVGFVSRSTTPPLSLNLVERHDYRDYWEPIHRPRGKRIVLEPGRFYLLATKEAVRIPKDLSGDIMAYDASAGEFRTHYAGFFDPGFGGDKGTIGVLEVRGRESPHSLEDNQPICLMVFERLCSEDPGYQGNYDDSRPSLSKFFTERWVAWEV